MEMETTLDGLPISEEKPYGAAIVVFKKKINETLFLVLHRSHEGPDYKGDWAWGSPAGGRIPGESIEQCMKRELFEETSLELDATLTDIGNEDWYVYYSEANPKAKVILSEEHDRFEWLPVEKAVTCCLPKFVGDQIRRVSELI